MRTVNALENASSKQFEECLDENFENFLGEYLEEHIQEYIGHKAKYFDEHFGKLFIKKFLLHSLQFDFQIRTFKIFGRFELCMSQEIYSHSNKRSE